MKELSRRTLFRATGLSAAALALAACGSGGTDAPTKSAGSTSTGGGTTGQAGGASGSVRYGFWGSTEREQLYLDAFKSFQSKNSGITIAPEFADYGAFQERFATQAAAHNAPDLYWIASPQVMTYYKNDLYYDLSSLSDLDLSDYTSDQIESFKLGGTLNNVPQVSSTPIASYNKTFLDDAGLAISDADWTWDGLAEFLIDYSKKAKGRKGIAYNANQDLSFEAWLRQHGQMLWTEDGTVGFDTDGIGGWLDWWEKLRKAGAALEPAEQDGVDMIWSTAGSKAMMIFCGVNEMVDQAPVFPKSDFELRTLPVAADAPSGWMFVYYSRIAMYKGIKDSAIAAATKVLNFDLNDPAMIKPTLSIGAPVNPRQLKAAADTATPDQKKMLSVMVDVGGQKQNPRYEAPAGTSTWRDDFNRTIESVALGQSSVSDASKQMISTLTANIQKAKG